MYSIAEDSKKMGVGGGGGFLGLTRKKQRMLSRVRMRARGRTLHRVQTVVLIEVYRRLQQTYRGVTLADDLVRQGEGA